VVQASGGLRLAPKARLEAGVTRKVCAQNLDGNGATKPGVVADVNLGHSTATNEVPHLVSAR
jgi:hypothetical protein